MKEVVIGNIARKTGIYPKVLKDADRIMIANSKFGPFNEDIDSWLYNLHYMRINEYPALSLLSRDYESAAPSINRCIEPDYDIEIWPRTFNLGKTGRLYLEGKRVHEERLMMDMDIYDAFNFARRLYPDLIAVHTSSGNVIVGNNEQWLVDPEQMMFMDQRLDYVMDATHLKPGRSLLPPDGHSSNTSVARKAKQYGGAVYFSQPYKTINEMNTNRADFLLWNIARVYDEKHVLMQTPEHHIGGIRMPVDMTILRHEFASLETRLVSVQMDLATCIHTLELTQFVQDIMFDNGKGFDVLKNRNFKISPDEPVRIGNMFEYLNYVT